VENNQGDVLIAWENEAIATIREYPEKYEIVYPSVSILAQPTVAVVDKVAKSNGTYQISTEYLKYLYSEKAQEIIAESGYRPYNQKILKKYENKFDLKMKLTKDNKLLIGLGIAVFVLLAKLFAIQIVDDKYKVDASNNSMVYDIIYPTRGIIYDRNGKIIVGNKVTYDILVTPKEVQPFDTAILSKVLNIQEDFIKDKMSEYERNKRKIGYQAMTFLKQISPEDYMRFAEVQYKFPGFKGQSRSIRDYPINAGGNLLGYVSEVDANYIKKHHGKYRPGDYAGKTGIEAAREKELKGEKGYQIYLRNSHNKIESRYKDGEMDLEAIPGHDVYTTIDADLQQYGQLLMQNKVGSLVAIEPSTGEILTLVSSPCLDVNIFLKLIYLLSCRYFRFILFDLPLCFET